MNPFIYALKQDAVKEKLMRLMVCREHAAVGETPGNNDTRRNVVVGTEQTGTAAAHQ